MKKKIIACFSIYIMTFNIAFACPEVQGEYSCPDPRGGVTKIVIQQNGNEFTLQGMPPIEHLVADGQWQQVGNSAYYRNARYKATCLESSISAAIQGDVYQSSFYTGKAMVQVTLEKLANGNLKRIAKGTIKGPFLQIPVNDQAVCNFVK